MKPERLIDIKKELLGRNATQLADISLRMAKYKKENKELLTYLLFYSDDPIAYTETVKLSLQNDFETLQKHYYYSIKALRKILRLLNRHAKFTASKQAELELLLWFCRNFLEYADTRSSHKPLVALFTRQLEKSMKILPKLHEDLQFDYSQIYNELVEDAHLKLRGFNQKEFTL